MNIGIYQSAASMSALERWQDSVTQNISSAQLPGYRKRSVEFSAQPNGQIQTGSSSSGDSKTSLFPSAAISTGSHFAGRQDNQCHSL